MIFSESLGAAETFAAKHGYEIDPNQELLALGIANAGSGLLGGLAGGGSLSQCAVNDGAGARSEVSPLIASALILVTVLVLTPLFTNLPEAVLAALIIYAISHLWKVAQFRRYHAEQPAEFWLGVATLIGVITLDVLPGLLIGVTSMLLLVIYHASRPHVAVLGRIPGIPGAYGDVERHPDYQRIPGLLVLRLGAPLFYANATPVRDRIKQLVGTSEPPPKRVVLEVGSTSRIDITSSEMLTELIATLRGAGIGFALAEVHRDVVATARRTGLLETLGAECCFRTTDQAVDALGVAAFSSH